MFHILFKTKHPMYGEQLSTLIGMEWYPPGLKNIWLQSWPAHLGVGAGLAALGWHRSRDSSFRVPADTLIAVGITLVSLALYYHAARFAEYYVPFAALSAGLAARDVAPARGYFKAHAAALLAWTAIAASAALATHQHLRLMPADRLARIALRMNELGRPGDVVFNSSWSDFMPLVWWADGFRYINGLDGHYLAYRDPARFAIWLSASAGAVEDPATVIQLAFGARFAVVGRQHATLAEQLMRSPRAVLQIAAPDGWLFELRR